VSGLFGFISNRADVGAAALEASVGSLDLGSGDGGLRWGIGFHHEGDVLLRRRPSDLRSALPMGQVLGGVKAACLIGHYGSASGASRRTEDTFPCRYRSWLYAHSGAVESSERLRTAIRRALPEFLRANLQADTVHELLFRLFLSSLHEAGALLGGGVSGPRAAEAVRRHLVTARRIAREAGAAPPAINVVAANGEFLVAARTGRRLAFRCVDNPRELDIMIGNRMPASYRTPPQVSMIYSDPAHAAGRFIDMAPHSALVLGPDGPPVCWSLDSSLACAAA
jgi:hypothetical protein